ncbi:MAG: Na+/H+ antiporter NhaA [Bacteroidota bacterium]|nr:Na+/H+ antiporter NhaA [Bacteroidota bacterium]
MNYRKPFNYSFMSFFRHNVSGGMLLIIMAVLAIIVANSPWSSYYNEFLNHPISLKFGSFNLLSHYGETLNMAGFINDFLMAIFFFHVGLEIKREVLVGELSTVRKALLPIIAACGGMITPVLVYYLIDHTAPGCSGSAIPMATDIAFSLGALSILGSRVPLGLKVFLTAFAVADDIGGILVIALFYATNLHLGFLLIAFALIALLLIASHFNIQHKGLYIFAGIAIWYLFLQSGVHSTVAGVLVAFTIPARPRLKLQKYISRIRESIQSFPISENESIVLTNDQLYELKNIEAASNKVISPLQYLEDKLSGFVNYIILPLFAFGNAGIVLSGSSSTLFGLVTFAVALGLIVGKPIGLFSFTWISVKLNLVSLPDDTDWKSLWGVCCLGGIGFTVSLFLANLSFASISPELLNQAKLGIVIGTVASAIIGCLFLNKTLPHQPKTIEKAE